MTAAQKQRLRDRARRITIDVVRMSQWLFMGAALYFIVFDKSIGLQESNPGLQASLYTLANITVRAWLGYRIAVAVLGKLRDNQRDTPDNMRIVARAILVGCVILTSR